MDVAARWRCCGVYLAGIETLRVMLGAVLRCILLLCEMVDSDIIILGTTFRAATGVVDQVYILSAVCNGGIGPMLFEILLVCNLYFAAFG